MNYRRKNMQTIVILLDPGKLRKSGFGPALPDSPTELWN